MIEMLISMNLFTMRVLHTKYISIYSFYLQEQRLSYNLSVFSNYTMFSELRRLRTNLRILTVLVNNGKAL